MVGIRTAAVLAIVFAMVLPGYAQGVQILSLAVFEKARWLPRKRITDRRSPSSVKSSNRSKLDRGAGKSGSYVLSSGTYETAILELSRVNRRSGGILPGSCSWESVTCGLAARTGPWNRFGWRSRSIPGIRGNARAVLLRACSEKYRAAGRRLEAIVRIGDPLDGHYQAARGYVEMATDLTGALAQNGRTSKWAHRLAGDLAADRKAWTEAVEEYRKAILADSTHARRAHLPRARTAKRGPIRRRRDRPTPTRARQA